MRWTRDSGAAARSADAAPPHGRRLSDRAASRPPRPSADHPWRRGYDAATGARPRAGRGQSTKRPVDAAGAVDAQTRPPRLAKRADAFRTAPTGRSREGDISISLRTGTFLFRVDTWAIVH